MKKTVICNIKMNQKLIPRAYISEDTSIEVSERKVRYPVNALLEKALRKDDNVDVLLLVKKDSFGEYERNTAEFIEELDSINSKIGADINYKIIDTEFEQTRTVHEKLMESIVDSIEDNSSIIADITFGPKDLPIIVFYALNFASKFLGCEVENIIYGKAEFKDGEIVSTSICDMLPLFSLGELTGIIRNMEPRKSREILKNLLSI